MHSETVVWYNSGNRFTLIRPSNGSTSYLAQLTPEQAIQAPLHAGQHFEIGESDAEDVAMTQSSQSNHA